MPLLEKRGVQVPVGMNVKTRLAPNLGDMEEEMKEQFQKMEERTWKKVARRTKTKEEIEAQKWKPGELWQRNGDITREIGKCWVAGWVRSVMWVLWVSFPERYTWHGQH